MKLFINICSFSNLSITSPTSQFILQPFCRFTNVTVHSPNLPLLHLRHSSFSNPSFASPASEALHLIHLASRPCNAQVVNPVLLPFMRQAADVLFQQDSTHPHIWCDATCSSWCTTTSLASTIPRSVAN